MSINLSGERPLTPSARSPDDRDRVAGKPMLFVALTLLLGALWALTHRYKGLTGDAELYALQALSRIHPGLASDLYFHDVSQDRFTIFSPLYEFCIRLLGLQNAALTLTCIFTVWFLVAAWFLVRALGRADLAFLSIAALIVTVGQYGAYSVFHFSEDWLTARSLAESLIVTALACHCYGRRYSALALGMLAFVIHPIMALPGLLLLACLWLPFRISMIGAAFGIAAALVTALVSSRLPQSGHYLTVIDAAWLEIVRERSQFLFLQLWSFNDFEINARPFICLTLSAMILPQAGARKLCVLAMLVGASGMAVALIAGLVGPIAVFLQGQAWRWVWIPAFLSVLLLVPTAARMWVDPKCGPLCAMFLVLGWTFSLVDGAACVSLVLVLWLLRDHIGERTAVYLRWAALLLGVIVAGWVVANGWTTAFAPSAETGREALILTRIRNMVGLDTAPVLLIGGLFYWIVTRKSRLGILLISAVLATCMSIVLPGSLKKIDKEGTQAEVNEFADWRAVIAATENVYVVPQHNSATFAWFTLERPSYLSVDQSAGVIYSRETAMEVKRRSDVLLPMLSPDWRVLTKMNKTRKGEDIAKSSAQPLTRERLVSICRDPALGFVVAKQEVGFTPLRHAHTGDWKNWYLYDCRRTRSEEPRT